MEDLLLSEADNVENARRKTNAKLFGRIRGAILKRLPESHLLFFYASVASTIAPPSLSQRTEMYLLNRNGLKQFVNWGLIA